MPAMRFEDRPFGGPQRCENPPFERLAIARYSARLPMLRFDLLKQNISFPARRIAAADGSGRRKKDELP